VKVEGAYHGLTERTDDKGRAFYTLSVEGLRIEIPTAVASGVVPILRALAVGSQVSCRVAPAWRGRDGNRWLSWILLSLDSRDGTAG